MKNELREKLNEYSKSKGWGTEDEIIREILIEATALKTYGHDEHRWYTLFSKVVKIGDTYIDFQTYTNSGDEQALDDDEWTSIVLDSAVEVYPKEVTVIDYVTSK